MLIIVDSEVDSLDHLVSHFTYKNYRKSIFSMVPSQDRRERQTFHNKNYFFENQGEYSRGISKIIFISGRSDGNVPANL